MLSYQLGSCITAEGTDGSPSPPRGRRVISFRPIAGTTYKNLEQRYFQNPQELPESGKFQYLTLLNGISYETHWLTWCNQAMELLNQTIEN
ncbi:hypothetical protein [Nostoc sp. NZL]|uniref:hypothetical protein n=1 Tax=Nostoc sp. NZL TaxID=2650612 RepID=UPI001E379848|nr:hypothetical protein [Nostoc sp. NZL]MBG1241102.1 hypothetical protein [Nostoc sp. NZL]